MCLPSDPGTLAPQAPIIAFCCDLLHAPLSARFPSKSGLIIHKHIVNHIAPRKTRVHALLLPTLRRPDNILAPRDLTISRNGKGVEGKEREGRRVIETEEGGHAKCPGGVGLGGESQSLNFSR
jgi:hypothetical protein